MVQTFVLDSSSTLYKNASCNFRQTIFQELYDLGGGILWAHNGSSRNLELLHLEKRTHVCIL